MLPGWRYTRPMVAALHANPADHVPAGYRDGGHTLLADAHGSTRGLLAWAGDPAAAPVLVQRYAYDAFGTQLGGTSGGGGGLTSGGEALTALLYSGERTDPTGLQYLRARYYDPATGRFNRLDPFFGKAHPHPFG